MKDMEWTNFTNSKGEEEQLRIIDEDVQFSRDTRFLMGSRDFVICCANVENVPITSELGRREIFVGTDHGCEVFISRTKVNEEDEEEMVQITLKKQPNWNSSIEFNVEDLHTIITTIANYQDKDILADVEEIGERDEREEQGTLEYTVETMEKMVELLNNLAEGLKREM